MTYEHLNDQAQRERDTADSMELLTDAEREALGADLAEEDASVPIDEVEKIELPDEEEEGDEPAEDAEEPAEEEAPAEEAPAATPAEAEPEPEPEAAPAQVAPVQEVGYQVPAVEGYDEKMAALAAERADAMAKLLDGELTAAEYAAVDARTLSEREALTSQQNRHQIAAEMEQQRAVNDWNRSINAVREQAKAEGIDYTPGTKEAAGWDRWVRQLGADPENNDKPGEWFLKEAHRLNSMQYNPQKSVPKVESAPAADKKPAPKPRTPDLSNIPPTLGSAPAASAVSEGDGGEFAHLANLKGIALERALARMTPDQEARYLES
jgi:hypothetical protein